MYIYMYKYTYTYIYTYTYLSISTSISISIYLYIYLYISPVQCRARIHGSAVRSASGAMVELRDPPVFRSVFEACVFQVGTLRGAKLARPEPKRAKTAL